MNLLYRGVAAGAIGVLSLTVGGLGVATAANGGSLRLGASNHATKTTTLTDRKGTPLALVGRTSKPPLTVNSSKEVAHLNAAKVGGRTAASLETTGSAAQFRHTGNNLFTGISLGTLASPTQVALTAPLKVGTYYLHASAETAVETGSGSITCDIAPTSQHSNQLATGAETTTSYSTESEDTVLAVTSPQTYAEYCYASQNDAVYFEGGIYALKVDRSAAGSVPTS
jgi:hypothetical protein